VYFFESIESSDLNALYSGAECLLFPSLAEGFGWPIIEAMASGCRVVTSNVPPMSQIAGDVAHLIDPRDCVTATEALEKVLNESLDEKKQRIQAGLERVLAFSTDTMVEKYLALFQKISAKYLV
jgi:glycosyltransferase involved in cell wall biosynthesis